MTTNVLTQEFVFAALEAERNGEKFSINLADVWEFSGYSRYDAAYRFLTQSTSLERGLHFSTELWKTPTGGRPSEIIKMSVKGFRFFLAKSNTPKGDETLWHLLDIVDAYRDSLERQLTASLQPSTELDTLKAELAEEEMRADNNHEMWQDTEKLVITLNTFIVDVLGVDLELLGLITHAHTIGQGEIFCQYLVDNKDKDLQTELAQAQKVNQFFKKKKKRFYDL